MKNLYSLMLSLATVGVLLFSTMLPAASLDPVDSTGVQVQRQEQNGVAYLSGGIGEDESKAIQQATGYNLHMTFSIGPENKYVPGCECDRREGARAGRVDAESGWSIGVRSVAPGQVHRSGNT